MTPKQRALKLKQSERDKRVIGLVRAGATLQQVADDLGLYDASHASRAWRAAVERAGPSIEDKKWARWKHRDRLESLFRASYPRAIGDGNGIKPDVKWFENCRKVLSDIAEFEGTGAAKEVRVGGARGAPPVQMSVVEYSEIAGMSDEQIDEAKRALIQALGNAAAAAATLGAESRSGDETEGAGEPD